MAAEMEVHMVADMKVDKVADMFADIVTKLGVPKRVPFILLLPNWVPFFFLPNWVPPIW